MFVINTGKQCSCKLIYQFQHKLKQASKQATRACSLKVKQTLETEQKPNLLKLKHVNKQTSRACSLKVKQQIQIEDRQDEQYEEYNDSEYTFRYEDLTTKLCDPSQLRTKPDGEDIKFGHIFTDHMLKVFYHRRLGGWQKPVIIPFENISLHPAAKVLHYATELFEGLKSYRGVDDKIRLYRPDLNMKRMNSSAVSSGLPTFDSQELIKCMKRLIQVDQEWVPHGTAHSLYLRPTLIGIDGSLGVQECESALLYVIMCPVGSYFSGQQQAVSLLADPAYTRAWPGGVGDKKMGSNYGPTIRVQSKASQRGLQQVLWLYGQDHQLTEVGTMNIFIMYENEFGEKILATPPLNGLILPGVTRQSIIQLCEQWNEFRVEQRTITMSEVVRLCNENRLLEMFGAGTACVVSPVSSIQYQDTELQIPTIEHPRPLYKRILETLTAIQYGKIGEHPWAVPIE